MAKKQIHLGYALYNSGTNPVGWMPNSREYATNIAYFRRYAQLAEAAKFDMIFRADAAYTRLDDIECWSRYLMHMNTLEPLTLFSALSQVTSHIGLVGTTFTEPYNVARQLATLDHMSGGRAGWNVVTSFSGQAARNFGRDAIPSHDELYARAREYVDVVRALWDTYEDDAIIHDPVSDYYFDPAKFHPVDFEGRHIRVNGGLNVARPPQGYPVMVQAAVTVMLGDTRAEAQAKYAALDAMVQAAVRIRQLSEDLGISLGGLPVDEPVPLEMLPETTSGILHNFQVTAGMLRDRMTLGEMMQVYRRATGGTPLCATPTEVADTIEEWVVDSACDGFVIIAPTAPSETELFCAQVIPELQRRGGCSARSMPAPRCVSIRPAAARKPPCGAGAGSRPDGWADAQHRWPGAENSAFLRNFS